MTEGQRTDKVARAAAAIMDGRFGEAWRHSPMLQSPEYKKAWAEADAATEPADEAQPGQILSGQSGWTTLSPKMSYLISGSDKRGGWDNDRDEWHVLVTQDEAAANALVEMLNAKLLEVYPKGALTNGHQMKDRPALVELISQHDPLGLSADFGYLSYWVTPVRQGG